MAEKKPQDLTAECFAEIGQKATVKKKFPQYQGYSTPST